MIPKTSENLDFDNLAINSNLTASDDEFIAKGSSGDDDDDLSYDSGRVRDVSEDSELDEAFTGDPNNRLSDAGIAGPSTPTISKKSSSSTIIASNSRPTRTLAKRRSTAVLAAVPKRTRQDEK